MMQPLASYAMRGPYQAILVATALGMLSLPLFPISWPLSFFSAAVVTLGVLTQSDRDSAIPLLGSSGLFVLIGAVLLGSPQLGLFYGLLVWLPAWLLGRLLKQSGSLGASLVTAGLAGWLVVVLSYAMLGDPATWWLSYFNEQALPALKEAGIEVPEQTVQNLALVVAWMTGSLAAWVVLGGIIALLIGRYWQTLLYQGEFREEFQHLRLGTVAAGAGLLVVAGAQFIGGQLGVFLVNLSIVTLMVFLFQGLAIVHALAARSATAGPVWVFLTYLALMLTLPYGLILLATLGILDNWIDIRRRFPATPG